MSEVRYEVTTHENENGDLILPIPPEVLKELKWKHGDELQIEINEKGEICLTKV